jgi:F-type H+-transporting ATPase subunit gamma
MPSLRHIRKRIATVRNTQQITKAMKMVAAAKFRKAQQAVLDARPFARELRTTLIRLSHHKDISDHPLLAHRLPILHEDLFVLTSDRGLCGSFNANVLHAVEHYILDNNETADRTQVITIGRKAHSFFKKQKYNIRFNIDGFLDTPTYSQALEIGEELAQRFIHSEMDQVTLVFNEYRSAVQQRVMFRRLLPLDPPEDIHDQREQIDCLYEPSKEILLNRIIHRYLANQIYMAALESVASEHGARMTAMENATENASDMIQRLTTQYNKARQGAITKELMEIVGGAEALKTSEA